MSNLFVSIYQLFARKKVLFYALLLLGLGGMIFCAAKIQFSENFMSMLPNEHQSAQLNKLLQGSKFTDKIVVCISSKDTTRTPDPDSLVMFADSFSLHLRDQLDPYMNKLVEKAEEGNVDQVLAVIDHNIPLFLEEKDYRRLDSLTTDSGIVARVQGNYRTLTGPAGIALKKFIVKDPLGINVFAYQKLRAFQPADQMEMYDQHFLTTDRKHLLIFIDPRYPSSETAKNKVFFSELDELIVSSANKGSYEVIYFGAPAVAVANVEQIHQDTFLTTVFSVLLLVLIVTLFFRRFSSTLLMLLPVAIGALAAIATLYLIKGEVSIIAIGAGSLVFGIAVNYSLHFLTHFHFKPDIKHVIKELSFPLTLGSLTTIGGFLCLRFVEAPVLRDLGLFAALTLLFAALASLIILPHFVRKKTVSAATSTLNTTFFDRLFGKLQGNKYCIGIIVLMTPVLLYYAGDVQFEKDMANINYMTPALKEAESRINSVSNFYQKSIFVLSTGKSLDDALLQTERIHPVLDSLQSAGKILSVNNVSTLLLSEKEQRIRINRWQQFWSPERKARVMNVLSTEGKKVNFNEKAFQPVQELLSKSFQYLSNSDKNLLKTTFLANFIETPSKPGDDYAVITVLKAPARYSAQIYSAIPTGPKLLVFDRQYVTDKLVRMVEEDFSFITLFSSLLVLIALMVSYGRMELALITFLPMVISWIWILGIMALFGIKFNIINIILSTLVFGLGDDYAVFTSDGMLQEYTRGRKSLASVRISILLSAITTVIGLGVLIFAGHPALRSISLVSIIGILCVWFVSQTLQPALFYLLIQHPTSRKEPPYSIWSLLKTLFAFAYFTFGAFLLTLIGVVLIKLIPFHRAKMKYAYHWVMCKFMASLTYIMANVKKTIINETGEDFSKPAIIIANHQSFLDILSLGMLHPKLILLTNKWVWNSPIFGAVVRLAEFYPVAGGIEKSVDLLEAKVKEGYSIVIFPEGTRSRDHIIQRFHKGAFFLAEKWQLDILPVLLHGTGDTITKGSFLLKDGHITVKILPRIAINNDNYGANYTARAKLIGRYFRSEYNTLVEKLETVHYFRNKLVSNYIYKGPVLEWYMKVKTRLENNYELFDRLLPKAGKILDLGCGYGFLSYMLSYTSKERVIKGIDYDEEKIEVAQHAYTREERLTFECADLTSYELDFSDAIVLNDVLHYLQPAEQLALLDRCVSALAPKGTLIIRDGFRELEKRHKGTRLSELFSTKLLGFNKTSGEGLSFLSFELIHKLTEKHQLEATKIDASKLTSNVVFVLRRKI